MSLDLIKNDKTFCLTIYLQINITEYEIIELKNDEDTLKVLAQSILKTILHNRNFGYF